MAISKLTCLPIQGYKNQQWFYHLTHNNIFVINYLNCVKKISPYFSVVLFFSLHKNVIPLGIQGLICQSQGFIYALKVPLGNCRKPQATFFIFIMVDMYTSSLCNAMFIDRATYMCYQSGIKTVISNPFQEMSIESLFNCLKDPQNQVTDKMAKNAEYFAQMLGQQKKYDMIPNHCTIVLLVTYCSSKNVYHSSRTS